MRAMLMAVAIAVASAAVTAGAAADGGPSPGVSWGWNGVVAPGGQIRYVAVPTGGARSTVVEVVRVLGGRVLRWTSIPGYYGVPLVALYGQAGGLSRDGKTLVLASSANVPRSHAATRFVVLSTRTLRSRAVIALRGSFSFDALAPDASTLYLIQYTSAQDYTRYRVRAYDMATQRLVPGAIVDKREPDEAMAGYPISRSTTADGQWAYTLYARQGRPPFVHALDTVKQQAFCIDLPLRLRQPKQMALRLRLRSDGTLAVFSGRSMMAEVDTTTFAVRKS